MVDEVPIEMRARQTFRLFGAVAGLMAILTFTMCVNAADLEPRSYSNTPVGLKFLIAGYNYTEGNVAFDPSVPIEDAKLHASSSLFGYAQSFGLWGCSAKFDIVAPYTWLDGNALVQGVRTRREVNGFADPMFRFSLNFLGAPALSVKDFKNYRQNLILGFGLRVSAPWGQYDPTRLVNIGTNRWSIKPELGISKAWGLWTVDVMPSVTFYTDNNDFMKGGTLTQKPLYAVQAHLIRSFRSGVWVALDSTYFTGAQSTANGVESDNRRADTHSGVTIALPVDRINSIKLNGGWGTSSRTGSYYNSIGAYWQIRWGT